MNKKIALALFALLLTFVLHPKNAQEDPYDKLSDESKAKFLILFFWDNDFIKNSIDWEYDRNTMGKLLKFEDYKKLKGNLFRGWEYENGLMFNGETVHIKELRGMPGTENYVEALGECLHYYLKKVHIKEDPKSQNKVEIFVAKVNKKSKLNKYPGLTVELRFRNSISKKEFIYRFTAGRRDGMVNGIKSVAIVVVKRINAFIDVRVEAFRKKMGQSS